MTAKDRSEVRLAVKLLTKAAGTDSHEEAMAFALRAYSVVADWLNACDAEGGTPRRRERRLLRDRRSVLRTLWPLTSHGTPVEPERGAAAYGQHHAPGETSPKTIDLRA